MPKLMPIKTVNVELKGDYEGFSVLMRTNVPYEIKMMLISGDMEKTLEALKVMILSWDITDVDGNVLPTPKMGTDMTKDIPDEVLSEMLTQYIEVLKSKTEIPKVPETPSKTI
jgi:hypothetical protein